MARQKRLRTIKTRDGITLEQAIENFLAYCQSKNLSPETVYWYRRHLSLYARSLNGHPWHDPKAIMHHIRECLNQGISSQTVDGRFRAFRAFFNWLEESELLDHNPMKHVKRPRVDCPLIRTFTPEHVESLLKQPDRATFTGLRDYTAMLTMLDTGVRLSKLLGLQVKDCDLSGCQLFVFGKGRKERIIPFGRRLKQALFVYLSVLQPKGADSWLFPNVYEEKMTRRAFEDRITSYGNMASVAGVRVSPHAFRHTFAKILLTNGGKIFFVKGLWTHQF